MLARLTESDLECLANIFPRPEIECFGAWSLHSSRVNRYGIETQSHCLHEVSAYCSEKLLDPLFDCCGLWVPSLASYCLETGLGPDPLSFGCFDFVELDLLVNIVRADFEAGQSWSVVKTVNGGQSRRVEWLDGSALVEDSRGVVDLALNRQTLVDFKCRVGVDPIWDQYQPITDFDPITGASEKEGVFNYNSYCRNLTRAVDKIEIFCGWH